MRTFAKSCHTEAMGNVVNLNKFKKKKKRQEESKQADINRVRHGRTQAEKDRALAERIRLARLVDGKRLEKDAKSDPPDENG
jgi:Domain of unknown function (DUF4169)